MIRKKREKIENFKKTTYFVFRICRFNKPEKVVEVKTEGYKDYYSLVSEVMKELQENKEEYYKIYLYGKREKWEKVL